MDRGVPLVAGGSRAAEVRDMYAALLRGELSGTDALTASQQMLQILMDSMANAVFWKDRDSRYLGCNKVFASFAGVEPALLLGKTDRDMPWADGGDFSADWFLDWDQQVMDAGEPRFGILECLRSAAGDLRWVSTNKVPLRDLDGEVIGVLGTFEDVTDRRRAEDELQRTLDDLDRRVQLRTTELVRANESLRREVEDRVRLQAEERQQRAYAEALRETAAAMTRTLDLEQVTEGVLAAVERLVSNDLVAIVLVGPSGEVESEAHHAGFGYDVEDDRLAPGEIGSLSIVQRLAHDPGPVVIDDPERAVGPARSVLGARVDVAGQLLGVVFVESALGEFYSSAHADRLGSVADQAGAAISNARLAARASELAAAEERQRLAHELHDAVNQTLWTAALTAESVLGDLDDDSPLQHRVSRLRQLTRGALAEMRGLLLELRPDELEQLGLDELIEHLITALECRRDLDVTLDLSPVDLAPATRLVFYRVAQEGLRNIAQHAEATGLEVRLQPGPPVELTIVDDGSGFDPEHVAPGHMGLKFMRERAASVGATVDITTAVGQGTTITVRAQHG
jgi:PAS domain S-box-containing protein